MKLTNKKVEQLTTNTKSYIVWDTDVRGFGVRVNLNAKKTFILMYVAPVSFFPHVVLLIITSRESFN